jgi:hypothetical protein
MNQTVSMPLHLLAAAFLAPLVPAVLQARPARPVLLAPAVLDPLVLPVLPVRLVPLGPLVPAVLVLLALPVRLAPPVPLVLPARLVPAVLVAPDRRRRDVTRTGAESAAA